MKFLKQKVIYDNWVCCMPYKFLEKISLADVAFEASGKTLEEMLESAALAVTNTMIKDIKKIAYKTNKKVNVVSEDVERLTHDFLQELIFLKDAKKLLFSDFKIKIKYGDKLELSATMEGEKLNMEKHELLVDVKAVTWHKFSVRKSGNKWKAIVVLDV